MKTLLSILLLLLLSTTYGEILSKSANGAFKINASKVDLFQLIKEYSRETNKNLFISSSIARKKINVEIIGVKSIDVKSFEKLLISLIVSEDLSVIQSKDKTNFSVLRKKDVRYDSIPLYNKISEVPDTDELVYFYKKLTNVSPKQVERAFRPFQSKVGRIYSEVNSRVIVMMDSARNVKNLYKIISQYDTPEMAAGIKASKKLNKELKSIASKKVPLSNKIENNIFLFISLFSLIFLIIGFMLRGFVIRKIEGGL